jgi:SAM-dependent methyltransferase
MRVDDYTLKTKRWLDDRYSHGVAEGRYVAHRPIYGFGVQPSERNHTFRLAVGLSVLKELNRLEGSSLADVGGGEGYVAALARRLLGYDSLLVDLSDSACARANELFGIPARSADLHDLPFADDSVDVVVLSEVIEHLRDPVRGLGECHRICRNAMVVTTLESSPLRLERWCRMMLRDLDKSHAERNYFHPDDFRALFGDGALLRSSCSLLGLVDESKLTAEDAKALIPVLAEPAPYGLGSAGVMVVVLKNPRARRPPRVDESTIFPQVFGFTVPLPNRVVAREVPLPTWVRDKPPGRPAAARSIGLEDYGTSASALSRWAVSAVLALTYSYRLLFMKGSLAAKYRWLRKAVDSGWIARRFSG